MKVLIISASPRKNGNSEVLCDRFMEGAQSVGHEVEKINLYEKKLEPCHACYACRNNHECIIRDDMDTIQNKMIEADVIVLSTPVYFYSMASQMKMLIDRCLPKYTQMKNKKFYYVITAADPSHEACRETILGFRGFLRCLDNAQECGVIYGTGAWDKGDIYQLEVYNEAYRMGAELK